MKFEAIVTIAAFIFFTSCNNNDDGRDVDPNSGNRISGIVTGPSGNPLQGVVVSFDDGTNFREVITDAAGQYFFDERGSGTIDLIFNGNPLRYLDMRDRQVSFGEFDRTFDKMLIPWEIEEIDFLTTPFIDNPDKTYSLIHHDFDELQMQPADFINLTSSIHFNNYETILTSVQSDEERDVTVSFYSMPQNTQYTLDNNETITYTDVLSWEKILTISTTTTPIGVLEPVTVNLASAYANFPDYDHSGSIIMVSEEIPETLGVTSPVDVLEIRLPYGDDFEF